MYNSEDDAKALVEEQYDKQGLFIAQYAFVVQFL